MEQHIRRAISETVLRQTKGVFWEFRFVEEESGMWRFQGEFWELWLFHEPIVVATTEAHRLRWIGHVERMDDNRLPKRIIDFKPRSKHPHGRPRGRWIDGVTRSLKAHNVGTETWGRETEIKRQFLKNAELQLEAWNTLASQNSDVIEKNWSQICFWIAK